MRKKPTVREIQSKNLRDVEKVRIEKKTAYETHRENWLYIDIRYNYIYRYRYLFTRVKYSRE